MLLGQDLPEDSRHSSHYTCSNTEHTAQIQAHLRHHQGWGEATRVSVWVISFSDSYG